MQAFAPEAVHRRLLDAARPALACTTARPLASQRAALADKLVELLACPEAKGGLDLQVQFCRRGDGFTETRFLITSEPDARIPCHLLVPEEAPRPVPVFFCLQGHSSGMQLSLERDNADAIGDRNYAVQALRRNYAALAIEIRGFGERRGRRPAALREPDYDPHSLDPNLTCKHAAMVALLLGRTSLGEKILDLRRALDALAHFCRGRRRPRLCDRQLRRRYARLVRRLRRAAPERPDPRFVLRHLCFQHRRRRSLLRQLPAGRVSLVRLPGPRAAHSTTPPRRRHGPGRPPVPACRRRGRLRPGARDLCRARCGGTLPLRLVSGRASLLCQRGLGRVRTRCSARDRAETLM